MMRLLFAALVLCGCDPWGDWTITGSGHGGTATATVSWDGGAVTVACAPVPDAGPDGPVYPPDPGPAVIAAGKKVLFLGDSITGVYIWQQNFTRGADAEFGGTTHPVWLNLGFNAATVSPRDWIPCDPDPATGLCRGPGKGSGTYLDIHHSPALSSSYASPGMVIIVFLGVNDVILTPPTPDAEFETNYNLLLDDLVARYPTAAIVVMGPWLAGSLKPDGYVYSTRPDGSNTLDGEMDRKRDIVKQICRERGLRFVDVRARWFEDDTNPLGQVVATDGWGVHPNGPGDQFLANMIRRYGVTLRY